MHPASLLSYYPTYSILDEIVSVKDYDELNIFVDLKNCLQSCYMEHTIVNLIESTKMSNRYDTSIFTSLLSFIAFHRIYAAKRNIKINFYIFFESGISYYHNNLSKKYKVSRRIDDLYGLDAIDRELFFTIMNQNLGLIEKACNKFPNVKVIRLLNLEADFVPYYLMSRQLVNQGPTIANITYSNDHDMCQNLTIDNTFIFVKVPQHKKIIRKGEGMERQLKTKSILPDEYQPLAISILGDPGDDVYGVKGVGGKRFANLEPELKSLVGSMEELNENVLNNKPIFNSTVNIKNKYLKSIIDAEVEKGLISTNLQLVSFEILSRVIDDPSTIELEKRRQRLVKIAETDELVELEKMRTVLEMNNVEIQGEDLDVVYT